MITNFKLFENINEVSLVVNQIKNDWIKQYGVDAEEEAMYASCDEFASNVSSELEDNEIECKILNTICYSKRIGGTSGYDVLVYRKKYNRWGNSVLPDYINNLKYFGEIEFPFHEWIYSNGKHYDFINSDGVDNVFDLQIFKDYFKNIITMCDNKF